MLDTGDYLASNNLFILIAVVVLAIGALLWFLRKPQNRHPMDNPAGHAAEERRARENSEHIIDPPATRQ